MASDITVSFTEAIKVSTGNIALKKSNGAVVATYDVATSSNLSISDKALTITPRSNLSINTTYSVVFDAGAIVDLNDNKYTQSGDYQFTTVDTIKPTLFSKSLPSLFSPEGTNDVVLIFSETIKPGTGSVIFKNTNTGVTTGYKVASATNISIEASTLTIIPPADLDSNSVYTVELDADAVTDLAGNKYSGLVVRYGSNGDDVISGEGGDNFISGGSGTDTVTFTNDSGDYLVSKEPETGRVYLTDKLGEELGYILDDVEKLSFRDLELDTSTLNYWGNKSDVDPLSESPIYRFYNTRDKAFFYTANKDEKNLVINNSSVEKNNIDEWPYVYQGSTFEAAHSYMNSSTLAPIFRFYNSKTGHHFFTVSEAEADMIKGKIASGEWPFEYEGTPFNVYSSDPYPNVTGQEIAIHRFYSESLGRHFFTGDPQEVESIKLTGLWDYEGIGFWGEILG